LSVQENMTADEGGGGKIEKLEIETEKEHCKLQTKKKDEKREKSGGSW